MSDHHKSRRAFLKTTGAASLVGVAGCLGGHETTDGNETTAGVSPANMASLPEGQEECVSVDGIERKDELLSKDGAAYQYSPNFQGSSGGHNSKNVEMCANCRFYCPPNPPNKVGACTEVEGPISSQHWCGLWQPREELTDGTVNHWEGRGSD